MSNYINGSSCDSSSLFQFDLMSSNIASSKQVVKSIHFSIYAFGQHQLGPDGKIYLARCNPGWPNTFTNDSVNTTLSVIQAPELLVPFCNFGLNTFSLGDKRVNFALPNIPNYNLGALTGSPCDTLTGVTELTATSATLTAYFNTSSHILNVNATSVQGKNGNLQVADVTGKIIYRKDVFINAGNLSENIYLPDLKVGVHILQLITDKEQLSIKFLR